ncbi:hypothetical protein SLS64_001233 [Diaporthe eres]
MGDPTGAAPRSKLKGIDQATNPRWATAKVTVRGTIVVLSLAATITKVDQNKRNMERKVNELLAIMEERGENANDVLASLRSPPPDYDSTKPSWPVEMPAMNQQPVEMSVDERPMEVVGSQVGQEMSVPGTDDLSGNQKFVLKP